MSQSSHARRSDFRSVKAARNAGLPLFEALEERQLLSAIVTAVFPLPAGTNFPGNLTVGPDNNIWYTTGLAARVGEINPAGVSITYSTRKIGTDGPQGLALSSNGDMYFDNFWENSIASITGRTHRITKLSGSYSGPEDLVNGPDGNLWFTSFNNAVGQVIPSTGAVTLFTHTGNSTANPPIPGESMVSFHNQLYFEEGDAIGRITTAGSYDGDFDTPSGGNVQAIAVVGKNLWFTENNKNPSPRFNYVGYVTPHGVMTEFKVPAADGTLAGLAGGADGNIYISAGENLVRMNKSGNITSTLDLGLANGGSDMVEGADGNVWFTEGVLDKIDVAYTSTGGGGSGIPVNPFAQGGPVADASGASNGGGVSGHSADDLLLASNPNAQGLF